MNIQFLGGSREVGGNGFLVHEKGTKLLLDYGVRIQPEPPQYPLKASPDFAILSHAHLDHCGALPVLYGKRKPPLYMTDVSLELTIMLLKDSLKIAKKENYKAPFSMHSINDMVKCTKLLNYDEKFSAGNFKCILYDAGHIPGSSGVLIESGGKKLFYTGDINTKDTRLLTKAALPSDIDVLLTESTYGFKEHPRRSAEEARLLRSVEESVANHETVLIPVFAIGRSQEVLLILEKYADKIAIDGMAIRATEVVTYYGRYLNDPKKLKKILDKVFIVRSREDREYAIKKFPIIIATAGMLSGGPALYYLKEIQGDANAKVLFVGFLVDDSPGKNLLKTGYFSSGREKYPVQCQLDRFDLSSHAGREGLEKIIKKTSPEHVISVHGDSCEAFAAEIAQAFGVKAYAPKKGDVVKF